VRKFGSFPKSLLTVSLLKSVRILFFFAMFFASSGWLFGESGEYLKLKLTRTGNKSAPLHPVLYVIPIHGEINRYRMVFIRRGIREAERKNASYIVFDINTFGGRVDSALQIASMIGSVRKARTIAFIPSLPEGTGVSWSAGSLISFSCSAIYMAPGTSIGAAAPVYETGGGMQMAPEKVVSAVRTQMAALAEKNGYPKAVAMAMVDKDLELYEVFIGGKMKLALAEDIPELKREAKKHHLSFEKGKLISPKGKLLTLTAGEMEEYGISSGTVATLDELYKRLSIKKEDVVFHNESVEDKIVALLTSAVVTSLLIMAGIVALYIEITSPGFGVPGTIAIICFAIVFIASGLLGNVGSLEILLFIMGVVLLIVEIFLIPGFGITGITGIILMVVGLILSRQGFLLPKFSWQWDILKTNILVVGSSIVGAVLLLAILIPLLPRLRPFNRLILETVQRDESGFVARPSTVKDELLGKRGVAVTTLRPVGKAVFGDEVLEVQAEAEFIERGSHVEIIDASENKIIVKRVI